MLRSRGVGADELGRFEAEVIPRTGEILQDFASTFDLGIDRGNLVVVIERRGRLVRLTALRPPGPEFGFDFVQIRLDRSEVTGEPFHLPFEACDLGGQFFPLAGSPRCGGRSLPLQFRDLPAQSVPPANRVPQRRGHRHAPAMSA